MNPNQVTLIAAAIATAFSHAVRGGQRKSPLTFSADGTTTAGAGAATIDCYASNKLNPDATKTDDWVLLGTITLVLGTTRTSGALPVDASYAYFMANLSAISGTNAAVNVYMG